MPMISDKYTGPGKLKLEVLTEANVRELNFFLFYN